ncbi:hypothetical protein AgCh_025477 [Apium graveolens]
MVAYGFAADASTTSMVLDLLKSKGWDPALLAQSREFLKGQDLVISNVGDSRAVMGTRDKDDHLTRMTVDLKSNLPDINDEKNLIVDNIVQGRQVWQIVCYDDLKPPTSPCPKAPGDGKDALAAATTVVDADGVKISESITSTPEHNAGVGELVFQCCGWRRNNLNTALWPSYVNISHFPRPYDCWHFTLFNLDLFGLLVAGGREDNYRRA